MNLFRFAASVAVLFAAAAVHAQCDPQSVDFGEEAWGLSPDAETTFFDTAYVGLDYADEVHLLVPSFAIDVVPDTPLNAPIDSVVIEAVLLVDTLSGDTLTFEDAGLEYICNNNGDCVDPCTFLGGGQYCASFSGVPTVEGNYILSMEVAVWATVFGFPLATPFSFDGFPFPILDPTNSVGESGTEALSLFPNPAQDRFRLDGAWGMEASVWNAEGRCVNRWTVNAATSEIDCSDWAEGLYILQLVGAQGSQQKRLVIQR